MINDHDLVIAADTAKFGIPEIIRGSYGTTATPNLFHNGIPIEKAFYISLTGRNLTSIEAERVGLISKSPAVPNTIPTKDQRYIRSHAMERMDSGPIMIGISDIFTASKLIAA